MNKKGVCIKDSYVLRYNYYCAVFALLLCHSLLSDVHVSQPLSVIDSEIARLIPYCITVIQAQNLGSGQGLFQGKSQNTLNFKTLTAGPNVTLTPGANDLTISASSGGAAPQYGYIYRLITTTVTAGTNVTFENNGLLSAGITHSTSVNPDQITLVNVGTYRVSVIVANRTTTYALYLDGVEINIGGVLAARFSNANNTFILPVTQAIFTTVSPNQVLTVRAITGMSLTALSGSVTASVLIEKIA